MPHVHNHPVADNFDRAFKVGIALNAIYVVVEAGFGIAYNSVALISDAGHNLSDILALVLAWGASWLSRSQPTERRTYGFKRATVLASLSSALLLCMALGIIIWESIQRLSEPSIVSGLVIMFAAGIGVFINGVTAWMFMRGRHSDLNIRGAYLHMATDAAVSLGVVVAGGIIFVTGWYWVDPVLALLVSVVILITGYSLLRESLDLAMDAVPRNIDVNKVWEFLSSQPGVLDVHHLHIWGMSTTETALTVHLVVERDIGGDEMLKSIADQLLEQFAIHHPTIQLECHLPEDDCVYGFDPDVAHEKLATR